MVFFTIWEGHPKELERQTHSAHRSRNIKTYKHCIAEQLLRLPISNLHCLQRDTFFAECFLQGFGKVGRRCWRTIRSAVLFHVVSHGVQEVMLRGTPEGLRGTEASTSSSKDLNRHRRERTERHWSLVPEHLQDGRPHDVVYF